MRRHVLSCRAVHCLICWLALALVAIHPLIHGTPLDSGALDALVQQMQAWAVLGGDR